MVLKTKTGRCFEFGYQIWETHLGRYEPVAIGNTFLVNNIQLCCVTLRDQHQSVQ